MRHVKKLPESEGRKRYLSSNGKPGDEKDRLLEACLQSRNSDLYDITLFALCTGMRRGEIFGLTWKDIRWTEQEAVVRSETSKTKRMRHVPLIKQALEVLQVRNKVRGISDDRVFKSHNFRKAWERATRIAELEDFKFHDLRHSCASYLVRAGIPLNVIGEILGHTQISTTQRYAHIAREQLHESMGRMSDLLG